MKVAALILAAVTSASSPVWSDVLDGSLQLRLNFDAAPVNTVVLDTNPNAEKHDGVNGGSDGGNLPAAWIANEGGRDGVMFFDASQPNQITVDAAPVFNARQGTLAFWMKSSLVTQTPNPYAVLFDRRSAGGDLLFQTPDGYFANQAERASGGHVNSQTTGANVTDGQWHHIAYVYDQDAAGSVALYVDGVIDVHGANSHSWSWAPDELIKLGKSHDPWWAAYTGFLDDFRFYNRMLTASEVAEVAGLGSHPQIIIGAAGQPKDLAVGEKETLSLSVTATFVNGDTAQLRYQWQKDSVDIPDATSATYTLTVSAADNQKKFRCVASAPGAPSVTSASATLTVLPEVGLIFAFDAAPVADVIMDSAPNVVKHPGANVGAAWVASEGTRQGVMSFDAELPSQITVAAAPELTSMRGTIAFWMKSAQTTPTPNPYAILFDRRAMPTDNVPLTGGDVLFQLPDGHLSNQAEVSGRMRVNEFSTVANLTDGEWHHVAYVYDQRAKGFVFLYVDGVCDSIRFNSRFWYWVPDQIIELGKSHDAFWAAYTGFLDEFRIYNRVLSSTEIAGLAGKLPPQLSVSRNGDRVTLTWDSGTLWSSGTVDGTFTELTSATSPYVVTPTLGQQQFYRARR